MSFQLLREVIEKRAKLVEQALHNETTKLENTVSGLEKENKELREKARRMQDVLKDILLKQGEVSQQLF